MTGWWKCVALVRDRRSLLCKGEGSLPADLMDSIKVAGVAHALDITEQAQQEKRRDILVSAAPELSSACRQRAAAVHSVVSKVPGGIPCTCCCALRVLWDLLCRQDR